MKINTTIRNVCKKLQTGKTPPTTEKKYFNGNVNWYTPGDLSSKLLKKSKRTITTLAYKNKKAITYPQGTVLLSCIGDIGKVGITTNTISSSNQQITGLIPDLLKINVEYLYYWCLKHKSLLESKATSAVVPILNNKRLNNIPISYEKDLGKQQKIASFLTRIEALTQKREESIQLLNELIKSTFLDMFGDPVLNPKKWEMKNISKFATIKIGPFGSLLHAKDYISGGIPLVNPIHIVDGEIQVNRNFTIDADKFKELSAYHLERNDIVVARRGEIGRCAIVKNNSKILCGTGSMFIRITDDYLPSLLQFMIFRTSLKNYLESKAKGVTMKNLNSSILGNMAVIIPPKPLQDKFASIVTKIEATKTKYQTSLEELNNLFNSTAQKAFKGELNLGNIAIIEKEISKEEVQMLDEDKILELIKSGSFEAKDHVNEKQSYDDIRDMVLKLMDEGKITQKFTDDKKMVLEIKQ